ncbi:leucine-rich repeat-containing protein 19-like [Sinocyclocheilus anshuiensis]|uniref:leucine-rich repeat-containing protein 19-like n=1 Tax=Sinocyclocheilus anshuiensis TaxID=1608454 RepID=UPI0007B9C92E|nr:PREDICTED: leucine-rich repeat-containing protein 19-like [Sinocyclocheilus anshuiensis]XP_016336034.1 PREDICTED: leucine-rich repeat-containing protein 19-like [Sinocyclocheilus anshuiensis]
MGYATHTVCVLLCFWVSGSCYTLQTVGPCMVNRETAAFDCSGKRLTSVPKHIWMNVTELDLSDNLLDLTHSDRFKRLNLFSHLVSLNLSGNYLPLLLKDHLYSLSSLKILDLSRCKLAAVEANALVKLSSLQMLLLGDIQSTAVKDLRLSQFVEQNNRQKVGDRGMMIRASKHMAQDDRNDGYSKDVNYGAFLRKLLTVEPPPSNNTINGTKTKTEDDPKTSSESWKVLVAVLGSAITLSVLIALMAKCKVVHKYLASYRHSRLSEVDATSQCDPANFEVGFSTQGGPGTRAAAPTHDIEEDDDGFIEDNYIQASESERATRAAALTDDDDEEEEEIEFSIG